uniref:Uncharacterized protein n=1 Tax=Junco hyemalis TaxID=40217 RepID=A0A8C5IG20_JUNHY
GRSKAGVQLLRGGIILICDSSSATSTLIAETAPWCWLLLRNDSQAPWELLFLRCFNEVCSFFPPLKCHQPCCLEDGFLAALEKDAKERAQRRRRNEKLANALKEQGNEAFRAGDFALAIQRYSEGLEKLRDKQELYTNRAQVSARAGATCGW